jgi:hypothetical protein
MKKSRTERTTAKNLEGKFDRGEEVLDYFDVAKARVIRPRPASSGTKTKFAYPAKRNASRSVVVREKAVTYQKNARGKAKQAQ